MAVKTAEPKQMRLMDFCREYGISRTKAMELIHRFNRPMKAYKIGGRWFVDMAAYKVWREIENETQRKW